MALEQPKAGRLDSCSSGQLAMLLALAERGSIAARSLRPLSRSRDELQEMLARCSVGSHGTATAVIAMLTDPSTPLESHSEVKRDAKRQLREASAGKEQEEVLTLVYHAAIAAALLMHDTVISSRPPDERLALYEDFADVFAGTPVGLLFQKTAEKLFPARDPRSGTRQ
jgi:hypothetical protein